ncbi:cytochrome P450 [Lactifluus volemus]|nr:cytochrome P450 [Lactifluus volemus]
MSFPLPPYLLLFFSLSFFYLFRSLFFVLIARFRSPLRLLPSPPSPSLFVGNLAQLIDEEKNDVFCNWIELYGHTFTYRSLISSYRLFTADTLALSYILGHAYDFPKPDFVTVALAETGAGHDGLLTAQGDVHRRQNQAFSPSHIKSIIPIFRQKAERLQAPPRESPVDSHHVSTCPDSFATHRSTFEPDYHTSNPRHRTSHPSATDSPVDARPIVDVLPWLARATLDVIGEAGFGYSLHCLSPPDVNHDAEKSNSELARAFATIFTPLPEFSVVAVLCLWFPFLRRFHPDNRAQQKAKVTVQRIGTRLIDECKASHVGDEPKFDAPISRDILSVLVRANAATSPYQALTHSEMLSQISTFIAAGHETTASALTWTLYALARAPAAQDRLRAMIRSCDFHAALDLPLLENTVREALRLHAPVGRTMRVYAGAAPECFIPVRHPVRVRLSTWSRLSRWFRHQENSQWDFQNGIHLRRGDIITIPIQTVNHSTDIWGPDARDFRPERWEALPPAVRTVPGLYAHTLTFLNGNGGGAGGNRSCIGYRFAITEIKVFLVCLLRDLEFSIDDDLIIEKHANIVTRPFVASTPKLGNQMPLHVRRVLPGEVVGAGERM